MEEELKKFILEVLADEDYLGGPPVRPYPRASREAIATAILAKLEGLQFGEGNDGA